MPVMYVYLFIKFIFIISSHLAALVSQKNNLAHSNNNNILYFIHIFIIEHISECNATLLACN